MKNIIYLILSLLLPLACTRKAPEPLPAVKEIVSKWRLEANEKTVKGQKVWEKIPDKSPHYLIFRYDGVVLDGSGKPRCCAPDSLVVNGMPLKIKPLTVVPENPDCYLVDCAATSTWNLVVRNDTLVITAEDKQARFRFSQRYVRE